MTFGNPRRLALCILNELDRGRTNLDRLLEKRLGHTPEQLPRRDRALAYAILYGVLRWRARLDWYIAAFSSRPLDKIHPEIRNIVRIGLFQLLFLSRVPQSAAVNTSVELAKTSGFPWAAGFVNGLLRTAAREAGCIAWPDPATDAAEALAVTASFPKWLLRRWIDGFGLEEAKRLCADLNQVPPLTVRANTLKTGRAELAEKLAGAADAVVPTDFAPAGLRVHGPHAPVHELPGFAAGHFQVQDEAAQLATLVLDPGPGERILDACAGLGGKTGHIAQCMQNRGELVALDRDPDKLAALSSEMHRLGVRIAETCCHDLENPPDAKSLGRFDRILLDAPCSGLGVIRRNPDIKWSARENDLDRYRRKQAAYLARVSGLLKTGGVLAYAVCSMEPEETDAVVNEFCRQSPDFEIESVAGTAAPLSRLADERGFLRLFPHRHRTDGFFVARMRRRR